MIPAAMGRTYWLNDYLALLVDLEFAKRFDAETSITPLKNVLSISTKSLKPQQHPGEIWEHYSIPAFDEARLAHI